MRPNHAWLSAIGAGAAFGLMAAPIHGAEPPALFTVEQAAPGQPTYGAQCARCHGVSLEGVGQFGPPLAGEGFIARWNGKDVSEYLKKVSSMPPGAAGSLDSRSYAAVAAYILRANGLPAGPAPLGPDRGRTIVVAAAAPPPKSRPPVGAATTTSGGELKRLSPVSEAMLRAPPTQDWLMWRRTYDSLGYSPLKQITARNVGALQLAWSWALPMGSMEATPIIHDGVLFIQSGGDTVQALDATTGEMLWSFVRAPAAAVDDPLGLSSIKRNMAIAGTRLFVATIDAHLLAIDARSGRLLWDREVADPSKHFYLSAGPVYAHGKVIQGISGSVSRQPGGAALVAYDASTGDEVWRFNTVARPGEPGGDTWNGVPLEKRSGGSVWVPGSYDPDLNLVYFGTGNTYDTAPFRTKASPDAKLDLLYTNTTLALDPDTGRLVWYFQHGANDLMDLDWAFEQSLLVLDGRKLLVTGGKTAIFDAVDPANGKYAFSRDMGLQNVVAAIDPKTGVKARAVLPAGTPPCPGPLGARNWTATSIDPAGVMYVPMDELCGSVPLAPRPGSDGKTGQLAAMDLRSGKVLWRDRTRATQTSAALATGGGVVFNATYDRWFRATDARTGRELWKVRLADLANAFPVTYAVNGKQYVAIAAGGLKPTIGIRGAATPEIRNPPTSGPVLWVFALHQGQ